MSDIAELQQRVRDAGQRFGQLAEKDRQYGARLASLLAQVEDCLTRGRREIDELKDELTRTQGENEQLKDMLQGLLAALENGGEPGIGTATHELESRINQLTEKASAISDSLRDSADEATWRSVMAEMAEISAPEPSPADETAPSAPESATAAETAAPCEPKSPPPEADPPAGDEPSSVAAEAPSDADLSTVNKIIQRVSLLTGEFREAEKKPDGASPTEDTPEDETPAEERAVQNQ